MGANGRDAGSIPGTDHPPEVPMKNRSWSRRIFRSFPRLRRCNGGEPPAFHPDWGTVCQMPSWLFIRSKSPAVCSTHGPAGTFAGPGLQCRHPRKAVITALLFLAVQEINDGGAIGESGGCPPGPAIRDLSGVYGPDACPRLPACSEKNARIAAMKGHQLRSGRTVPFRSRQVR
jgi:hypothetical protein